MPTLELHTVHLDGFEEAEGLTTEATFVDLRAAYDAVDHMIFTRKLFEATRSEVDKSDLIPPH